MTHRTVSFDGMCWPLPNEEVEDRLRHSPDHQHKNDLMIAAQIMSAYRAMISHETPISIIGGKSWKG